MKAVYTVLVKRRTTGALDAHGNPVEGLSDPEPLAVYAIAPTGSQEPGSGRLDVTTGLSLLLPSEAVLGPLDVVVVDGEDWQVEGEVADYTRGPFGYRAGRVASLTRTEG